MCFFFTCPLSMKTAELRFFKFKKEVIQAFSLEKIIIS